MEAAGLALAIAGLAGQAISGITTLKGIVAAHKYAHVKVSRLNFELESLAFTLIEAQHILRRARQDDGLAQLDQRHTASQGHQPSPTGYPRKRLRHPQTVKQASVKRQGILRSRRSRRA